MKYCKKVLVAASVLLAAFWSTSAQTLDKEPEGVYVYTSVEDFNYETLSGKLKIESYVKDSIPNPIPPTPLDLVFVIDVSGSMGYPITTLSPEAQPEQGYSYSAINSRASAAETQYNPSLYYLHTDGKYYKVEAYKSSSNKYYLRFDTDLTNGESWCYLYGTEVKSSTSGSSSTSNSSTIWTGVLYKYPSRLEVVKKASQDFVDVIAASSSSEVDNKIALVKFSANNTTNTKIVRNLTSVLTGADNLKNDIDGFSANGGTYPNTGLNRVLDIFTGAGSDDRQRVVILFTDGAPSATNSDGGAKVASEAINNSKTLKDRGATVYTVGILDATNLTSITEDMMNYVSSKYPDSSASYSSYTKKMSTTPGDPVEGDFFFNSPDGSAIPSIFAQIAEMVAPTLLILGTESKVKNSFEASIKLNIPAGATSIKAYTAECTGFNPSDTTYTFGDPSPFNGLSITLSDDGKSIETNGFDYSDNWCGPDGAGLHGKELILEIPFNFIPTVDNLNDKEIDMNDRAAGMYKDSSKVASAKLSSAVPFAELTIEKKGLHKGESTIFEIIREKLGSETANVPVNRIVLTGTDEDGFTDASYTLHYLNPDATYDVIEHADWSWTYKPKETVTGGLVTKSQAMPDAPVGTNGGKSATLTFENTKHAEEKLPKNAEAIK